MLAEKRKIINDPVHGFISLQGDLVWKIIDSLWFQRLRRIKQLGLTHLVYPGALHTRFHHSIGAVHLMQQAIAALRIKGVEISREEEEGSVLAILLHDIGHGPFSHALEYAIVKDISHETLSLRFMQELNRQHGGALETALAIFEGRYHRTFFHQLVSGQLDADRLDYLKRDSFFTGVSEGVIGTERIIKMLDVQDDRLVVEEKGIYSIEKYLLARRLMYWQVYHHKTVLAADSLLIQILKRARFLFANGDSLFSTPSLRFFLEGKATGSDMVNRERLDQFAALDDFDVIASVKVWAGHSDRVLATLSSMLMSRSLFKCLIQNDPFSEEFHERVIRRVQQWLPVSAEEAACFVHSDITSNSAYSPDSGPILIQLKDGTLRQMEEVAEQLNLSGEAIMRVKYFCCYPKEIAEAV
ncbi:MAG TPA: HD domain-containing protein [Bacteroidales bacterium]|nr:HD domain-containing protein [Bacteroidales bacterium]